MVQRENGLIPTGQLHLFLKKHVSLISFDLHKIYFYLYIFGFSKIVGTGNVPHHKSRWKSNLYCLPKRHLDLKRGQGGGGGEVGNRSTKRMIQKRLKGQFR